MSIKCVVFIIFINVIWFDLYEYVYVIKYIFVSMEIDMRFVFVVIIVVIFLVESRDCCNIVCLYVEIR